MKFEITKSDDPTQLPGLAIFKEGGTPQIQPDNSYPDWLWELTKPQPLYSQLLYKATHEGLETLSTQEVKGLISMRLPSQPLSCAQELQATADAAIATM